ncbi:phage tail tape measure protein [uncultured Senegalimassilia sp.]|uniref:phage tail tape measure protein n=1 Tax=uncultured Senegalimassilia sp. TaxID=1714350 RepID=UPI0027DE0C1B|nr:phage tail tape measure protein [uncultured Senegalimassilia sp.]
MAKSKNEVEIRFSANTDEFRAEMKSANAAMTQLRGELKLNAAQMKNTGTSIDGLTAKQKILQQQDETLKQKIAAITAQLERSNAAFGENSAESQRLTNQLNAARTAQEKVRSQITQTNQAIEQQRAAQSQAQSAYSQLTQTISQQQAKLTALQREYASAVIAKGKDSTEAKQLEGKIRSLNTELSQNKAKMNEAETAARSLASEERDLGNAAERAGDGFTVAKGIISNFATDALMTGAQKTKELAGDIVELGSTFESSLSKVAALSGASADQMAQLEAKARELGSSTNFTASQVADAFGYMALAGWDTQQSLDGIAGVLTLAQAGEMDLAAASDLLTDYLSAFGLQASDSAMMADVLAYAQGHANTNTEQLGQAFKNCAANCNAAGMDVQTTTAFISELSNQGLKGSEAGTALTAVMRDMTSQMEDGQIAIGDTSVAVMDASGNYRDMVDIVQDIESATDGMGDAQKASALQSTFTADSIKGLNLILNAGAGSVGDFRNQLYGANGAAQDMASTMTDNLNGDLATMQSAFEETGLKVYDKFQEPLRGAVQFVTGTVVPGITWLIENFDQIAPVLGAAGAAIAAFAIVANIQSVVSGVTGAVGALGSGISFLSSPIGIAALAIAALVAILIYLWNTNEQFREVVTNVWNFASATIGQAVEAASPYISMLVSFFLDYLLPALASLAEGFGMAFASIVEGAIGFAASLLQIIQGGMEVVQGVIDLVMGAIIGIFTGDWSLAQQGTQEILNGLSNIVIGILNGMFAAVGGVLNAIASTFSGVFNSVLSVVSGIFSGIADAIGEKMGNARDTVSGVIDAIKGFFSFRVSWPHIPLPHITYSLINVPLLGDIPDPQTISVEWYAKGAVLKRPTLFGFNGGRAMVGGEAGPEAIAPVSTLVDYVQTAAERAQLRGTGAIVDAIERLAKRKTVLNLDGRAIAEGTASARDSVDGTRQTFVDRGLAV